MKLFDRLFGRSTEPDALRGWVDSVGRLASEKPDHAALDEQLLPKGRLKIEAALWLELRRIGSDRGQQNWARLCARCLVNLGRFQSGVLAAAKVMEDIFTTGSASYMQTEKIAPAAAAIERLDERAAADGARIRTAIEAEGFVHLL